MSNPFTILLVEDEENIRNTVKLNLEMDNYAVTDVDNGKSALREFGRQEFDLVILDVMLPEMNGFEICEHIRKIDKNVPVLFLTAKSSSSEKIQGLRIGADDYLTKPFNLEELLLRVQNLLKRNPKNSMPEIAHPVYTFGNNTVNFATYEIVDFRGNRQTITHREMQLLRLLIDHKNEVVSRDEILEKIWGDELSPTARTIDNYILVFRKYFEIHPKDPRHFLSIRSVGYKFVE